MYKKWTLKDIEIVIKELELKWNYPCNIPIEISKRAKKRMGAFFYIKKEGLVEPIKLVFSYDLLDGRYSEEIVREVITHEYIHFYCDVKTGISNGHNKLFKQTCRLNGISESTTFKYGINDLASGKVYKIYCKGCGNLICIHKRKDAVERKIQRYISTCCKKKLEVRD